LWRVNASGALPATIDGFVFSLSLIIAIGPQNVFVLRQAALREHVAEVVAICAVSDLVLIVAGIAGLGAALGHRQELFVVTRVLAGAVLLTYGTAAARRAVARLPNPGAPVTASSRSSVLATCLALTWLNPAVYVDTILLLGSIANTHRGEQWWFGGGAGLASVLWFIALAFCAGLLGAKLTHGRSRRVLDAVIAVTMIQTAVRQLVAV
jgi:L-lysine exporter family protein LysE/ArgO